jgi:hypothetical protein
VLVICHVIILRTRRSLFGVKCVGGGNIPCCSCALFLVLISGASRVRGGRYGYQCPALRSRREKYPGEVERGGVLRNMQAREWWEMEMETGMEAGGTVLVTPRPISARLKFPSTIHTKHNTCYCEHCKS